MDDEFKRRIREAYSQEDNWEAVLRVLERDRVNTRNENDEPDSENTAQDRDTPPPGLRFFKRNDLLYFKDQNRGHERLYIPAALEQEVF